MSEGGPGSPRRRNGGGVLLWVASAWLMLVGLSASVAPWLPLADPEDPDLDNRLAPPLTDGHLLGTDGLGHDILARLVHGGQVTLAISAAAVTLGLLVGGSIGLVAGLYRGPVEAVAMWLTNVILAFPALVLLLALVAYYGRSMLSIILAAGFVSIPTYARVARATTLAVSQRDYVLAARVVGASRRRILVREILPNVAWPLLAFALVMLGVLIVLETSLAFLGLSVDAISWGDMIAQGRRHMPTTVNPVATPSVVVFLTVLSVTFVGDVLRSRFDVREPTV